jgi:hypothetical protein
MNDDYIFKKVIDWSALNLGVNIPILLQGAFYDSLKITLKKGETRKVRLLLDGVEYKVLLSNIGFDEQKYQGHKEILQLKWTTQSDLAKNLQSIFWSSYRYLFEKRASLLNKRQQVCTPAGKQEYLVFYSSTDPDLFLLECITIDEVLEGRSVIKDMDELDVEQILQAKDKAKYVVRPQLVKFRKLDQAIGEGLKKYYAYRCQICGLSVGGTYGTTIAHTHHIEYFCTSLNNNASNIMIVCPNHHGIIHAINPCFDWKERQFVYPNGLHEGLKLNKHL